MNPEIKAKWVAALRSGEYKQGKERLYSPSQGYCCLGVLTDLYSKEVLGIPYLGEDDLKKYGEDYLCDEVMAWAGLPNSDPEVDESLVIINGVPPSLSQLNDAGFTFNDIADIIEEKL
jgi:hypothetical protein